MTQIIVPRRKTLLGQDTTPFQNLNINPGQFGGEQAQQLAAFGGAIKSLASAFKGRGGASSGASGTASDVGAGTLDPTLDPTPAPTGLDMTSPLLKKNFRHARARSNAAAEIFSAKERAMVTTFRGFDDSLSASGPQSVEMLARERAQLTASLPSDAQPFFADITKGTMDRFGRKMKLLTASKAANFQRIELDKRFANLAQDAADAPNRIEDIVGEVVTEVTAALATDLVSEDDFQAVLDQRIAQVSDAAANELLDTNPDELRDRLSDGGNATGLFLDDASRAKLIARADALIEKRTAAAELTESARILDATDQLRTAGKNGLVNAKLLAQCQGKCPQDVVDTFTAWNDGVLAVPGDANVGVNAGVLGEAPALAVNFGGTDVIAKFGRVSEALTGVPVAINTAGEIVLTSANGRETVLNERQFTDLVDQLTEQLSDQVGDGALEFDDRGNVFMRGADGVVRPVTSEVTPEAAERMLVGNDGGGVQDPDGPAPNIPGFLGLNRDATGQNFIVMRGADGKGIALAPISPEDAAALEAEFGNLQTRIGASRHVSVFVTGPDGQPAIQLTPAQRLAEGVETRPLTPAELEIFDLLPESARLPLDRPERMGRIEFANDGVDRAEPISVETISEVVDQVLVNPFTVFDREKLPDDIRTLFEEVERLGQGERRTLTFLNTLDNPRLTPEQITAFADGFDKLQTAITVAGGVVGMAAGLGIASPVLGSVGMVAGTMVASLVASEMESRIRAAAMRSEVDRQEMETGVKLLRVFFPDGRDEPRTDIRIDLGDGETATFAELLVRSESLARLVNGLSTGGLLDLRETVAGLILTEGDAGDVFQIDSETMTVKLSLAGVDAASDELITMLGAFGESHVESIEVALTELDRLVKLESLPQLVGSLEGLDRQLRQFEEALPNNRLIGNGIERDIEPMRTEIDNRLRISRAELVRNLDFFEILNENQIERERNRGQ